jgi:hypothetical protein
MAMTSKFHTKQLKYLINVQWFTLLNFINEYKNYFNAVF